MKTDQWQVWCVAMGAFHWQRGTKARRKKRGKGTKMLSVPRKDDGRKEEGGGGGRGASSPTRKSDMARLRKKKLLWFLRVLSTTKAMMTSALPVTTTTTRVTMSTDRITDRYPGRTVPASATSRVKLPLELESSICAPILTAEARSWCIRLISRARAARGSN